MPDASDLPLLHAHLRGEHSDERHPDCVACGGLPAVSTPEERPVRQNTGSPATGRTCGCGCGAPVARRFLPGHDARLKSRLVKAARAGDLLALDRLREHGWEHFI